METIKEYKEFAKKVTDIGDNFSFRIVSSKTNEQFFIVQVKDLFEEEWYNIVKDRDGLCKSKNKMTTFTSRTEALLIIKEFRYVMDNDLIVEYIDPATLGR